MSGGDVVMPTLKGRCGRCGWSSFDYNNGAEHAADGTRGYRCSGCGSIKPEDWRRRIEPVQAAKVTIYTGPSAVGQVARKIRTLAARDPSLDDVILDLFEGTEAVYIAVHTDALKGAEALIKSIVPWSRPVATRLNFPRNWPGRP